MTSISNNLESLNDLSYQIIGAAYKVHRELGPGLLESTYEVCLEYELSLAGFHVERQKLLPVIYCGVKLDAGYRIDLLIEQQVVLEKICRIDCTCTQGPIINIVETFWVKAGLTAQF